MTTIPRRPRTRREILLGGAAALGAVAVGFGNERSAHAATYWYLLTPCTSTGRDDTGHPDNAIDFGANGWTPVQLYLNDGSIFNPGWAKISSVVNSCSTVGHPSHRRISYTLHKGDKSPSGGFGTGVSSHSVPYSFTVPGYWVGGGGTAICRIGPNETGWTSSSCWTGTHTHFGANGTKLTNYIGSPTAVSAGQIRHWRWSV